MICIIVNKFFHLQTSVGEEIKGLLKFVSGSDFAGKEREGPPHPNLISTKVSLLLILMLSKKGDFCGS